MNVSSTKWWVLKKTHSLGFHPPMRRPFPASWWGWCRGCRERQRLHLKMNVGKSLSHNRTRYSKQPMPSNDFLTRNNIGTHLFTKESFIMLILIQWNCLQLSKSEPISNNHMYVQVHTWELKYRCLFTSWVISSVFQSAQSGNQGPKNFITSLRGQVVQIGKNSLEEQNRI